MVLCLALFVGVCDKGGIVVTLGGARSGRARAGRVGSERGCERRFGPRGHRRGRIARGGPTHRIDRDGPRVRLHAWAPSPIGWFAGL